MQRCLLRLCSPPARLIARVLSQDTSGLAPERRGGFPLISGGCPTASVESLKLTHQLDISN